MEVGVCCCVTSYQAKPEDRGAAGEGLAAHSGRGRELIDADLVIAGGALGAAHEDLDVSASKGPTGVEGGVPRTAGGQLGQCPLQALLGSPQMRHFACEATH